MSDYEKLHTGDIYFPAAPEIDQFQTACMEKLYDYNQTRPGEGERRAALLKEMFAQIGNGCYIEPPLYANFGGHHVHFGNFVYANYGLTLVDDTHIYVGDQTMFGPHVTIATAGHPIDPELRGQGLQYNMPVHIGRNCWLGAGVVVLPGVTIGDDTVIGAGSVVTKNIPSGVVAAGNPCRVLREVGEKDRAFYFRNRQVPPEFFEKNQK